MAWTTPLTAVSNAALTAAQWNASVRDNLLETAVAKVTGNSWPAHYVANGVNTLAERLIRDNNVDTSESTASTSFTDLATVGPSVTITTGSYLIAFSNCDLTNSSAGASTRTGVDITGATTSPSTDGRGVRLEPSAGQNARMGATQLLSCTAGSNTVKMVYRAASGTGTYATRRITVMGL